MSRQEEVHKKKVNAMQRLIELSGGTQISMAKLFKVTRQVVSGYWIKQGLPIRYISKVEELFGNKIDKIDIWPDYFEKPNKNKSSL